MADSGPGAMDTWAEAEMLPTLTVTVPDATVVAAVRTPAVETVPSPVDADHVRLRPEIMLPKRSKAVALNSKVPPAVTVATKGDSAMRSRGPGETVTVIVSDTGPPSTLMTESPASTPATNRALSPVSLIGSTDPTPLVTDHKYS